MRFGEKASAEELKVVEVERDGYVVAAHRALAERRAREAEIAAEVLKLSAATKPPDRLSHATTESSTRERFLQATVLLPDSQRRLALAEIDRIAAEQELEQARAAARQLVFDMRAAGRRERVRRLDEALAVAAEANLALAKYDGETARLTQTRVEPIVWPSLLPDGFEHGHTSMLGHWRSMMHRAGLLNGSK